MTESAFSKGRYFEGLGRRKRSIARVRLYSGGKGKFIVNGKEKEGDRVWLEPLDLLGLKNQFDCTIIVSGGGRVGQKEAIRLGMSRALVKYDEKLRPNLRKAGFLTRDPREKERKKPGLKRARRAPQWQKR